jgi:hypothetical protein
MSLATRITDHRRAGASRAARRHKEAAGKRVDEIGAVKDIAPIYAAVDRAGDLAMEDEFRRLYALATDEEQKTAVARTYAVWMAAERREDMAVTGSVDDAVTLLKHNNDFWLGCVVPSGSDDAA